ncbi:MAG: sigma-70 family RNA polymerase sigma factor [Sarcina sp.]
MITKENYIEEMRRKNIESIEFTIDIYGKLVYKIAYDILKSKEYTEECVNDLFFKVWINIDKFDEESGEFKTWISVMIKNLAIDLLRKNNRKKEFFLEEYTQKEVEAENEVIEIKANELMKVRLAIEAFPEIDKYIFINRFFLKRKIVDIANELNLSKNNVAVRICRGRKRLRELELKEKNN